MQRHNHDLADVCEVCGPLLAELASLLNQVTEEIRAEKKEARRNNLKGKQP